MSSVWKSPHGSEEMPEIMVKIIGSKHFRYLKEKPNFKRDEKLKAETQTALQKPRTDYARKVNKDLSAPTDPPNQSTDDKPDDKEASKQPGNHQKSENHQTLRTGALRSRLLTDKIPHEETLHCSSVPTGDQSLSYMHRLPWRRPRDCSLEQTARGSSGPPEDTVQRPSTMTREDCFLLALVRRELKSYPLSSSLLDKLQRELKTLDPISSGFLLQSQVSRLFLRHQVPLQLPTIKLLCQRFSRRGYPEMVNYGKLLRFLKGVTSNGLQQNKTAVDSNPRKTPSCSQHRQSTPPQDSSLQSEMNEVLLGILKMVLRTSKVKLNIDNLNLSFRKEDRSFSGCLPVPKVRAICGKHGLYLTLSLLETLLNHQDLGYQGEIKWQNFVKWLDRASSGLLCDLPEGKNEKKAPRKLEVPERPLKGRTEYMNTPEESLWPENPPALTSAPQDPVNSLKVRPASQPFESPAVIKEPERHEMWIDRFRKLENALYQCDLSNTGVLEKERARRLIHNYNLMYSLSLSPRKIDQALRRFRSGENMLLEPALQYLKEL